jgi:lipopolysaccharide biosynthesis regulator YciM
LLSRRHRGVCLLLSAAVLVAAAGCASSTSPRDSGGSAARSAADPMGELARLAELQVRQKDERALAAAPPLGIPAELSTAIPEAESAKARMALNEVLAQWPDPVAPEPAARPAAAEPGDEADDAELEALRSYVVGRAQRLGGDAKAAEASLRESARLDPDSSRTWGELAEANLMLGNPSAAAAALRRTLELDPFNLRALDLQSRLEMDRRTYDQAAPLLARLLRHSPERLDPALPKVAGARLGEALLNLGYVRAGAEALTGALELPQSFVEVTAYQQELGLLYRERGDLWRDAGDAYLRLGDGSAAVEAYTNASRLPTLNPASLVARRVYAAMRGGEPAKAALLLLDEVEGSAGQIDQSTVGLIGHVARNSSVGPLLAGGVERVGESMYPPPRAAVRGLLVRARAAALPDAQATVILREHLAAQPGDGEALRELMQRSGASDARSRIDEVLALIELAPIYESRFAQALVASQGDSEAVLAALSGHPKASSNAGRLLAARLHTLRGELEAADVGLASLCAEQPSYAPAAVARTIGLIRLGRAGEASDLLKTIDEGADSGLRVAKTLALAELGDPEAALAMLAPLLEPSAPNSPGRVEHLLLGARLNAQLGKLPNAERLLLSVLELDPARDEAFADLVRLYNRGSPLASDEKLVDLIRRVRDADPSSPTLRWLRAQESIQRRQYDLAKRDLLDLAEEYPDRPGVVEQLVRVWAALGDSAGLEKWLRDKAERNPDNSVFTSQLGGLLDSQKRTTEAVSLLESRLAARPGDELISRTLEEVLRRNPDTRRRADELAAARIARGPQTPDSQAEMAELALNRGAAGEAMEIIGRLLDSPRKPSPTLSQRTSRIASDIAQRALSGTGNIDRAAALQLLRRANAAAPGASVESRQTELRLMVRMRQTTTAIIDSIEAASKQNEAIRLPLYVAAIDEMFTPEAKGKPDNARDLEGFELLERGCATIRPAPTELQAFWVLRTLDTDRGANSEGLAKAVSSIRQANNLDEVLAAIAKPVGQPALDDIAYELGLRLHQEQYGELVEWLYRNAIRLNPRNIWANNNLGYRLLTDDREIDEAAAMIEIAYEGLKGEPNAGERASVTDSLGWARYKQGIILDEKDADGNVVREGAVTLLSRGFDLVKAEPRNADAVAIIADHLADAYWVAGDRERAVQTWVEAKARGRAAVDKTRGQFDNQNQSTIDEVAQVVEKVSAKLDAVNAGRPPEVCKVHHPPNVPAAAGEAPIAPPPAPAVAQPAGPDPPAPG